MRSHHNIKQTLLTLALPLLVATATHAQYTPAAGQNAPAAALEMRRDEASGKVEVKAATRADAQVQRDTHGNARGNQYDLAIDGAFEGQTVLILDQVGNTLENTKAALKEKGLNTVAYRSGTTPSPKELKIALEKSCQLWIISSMTPMLNDQHIAIIKQFFDAGHGVYIWGDNDPLYVDANKLASALIPGLRMEGNLYGDKVVGIASQGKTSGVQPGHLITTGLEHLYEGVTIATIQFESRQGQRNVALYDDGKATEDRSPPLPKGFTPILHGSAGNLVTVAYEQDGKRLVMDGGFTRLAVSWDDAGTARFVKNAASWLVNAERFKDKVATK